MQQRLSQVLCLGPRRWPPTFLCLLFGGSLSFLPVLALNLRCYSSSAFSCVPLSHSVPHLGVFWVSDCPFESPAHSLLKGTVSGFLLSLAYCYGKTLDTLQPNPGQGEASAVSEEGGHKRQPCLSGCHSMAWSHQGLSTKRRRTLGNSPSLATPYDIKSRPLLGDVHCAILHPNNNNNKKKSGK